MAQEPRTKGWVQGLTKEEAAIPLTIKDEVEIDFVLGQIQVESEIMHSNTSERV